MIFWKRVHFESNVKPFGEEGIKRFLLFLFVYLLFYERGVFWYGNVKYQLLGRRVLGKSLEKIFYYVSSRMQSSRFKTIFGNLLLKKRGSQTFLQKEKAKINFLKYLGKICHFIFKNGENGEILFSTAYTVMCNILLQNVRPSTDLYTTGSKKALSSSHN